MLMFVDSLSTNTTPSIGSFTMAVQYRFPFKMVNSLIDIPHHPRDRILTNRSRMVGSEASPKTAAETTNRYDTGHKAYDLRAENAVTR